MINLEEVIYLLLTVFIPLKCTYHEIRHQNAEAKKLWAVYWAFYFVFKSLQSNFQLFQYRFLDFVFVLLALWIYNDSYKVRQCFDVGWTLLGRFPEGEDGQHPGSFQCHQDNVSPLTIIGIKKPHLCHFSKRRRQKSKCQNRRLNDTLKFIYIALILKAEGPNLIKNSGS